jgi:glycosyltransferase involved in cell wall biosynthesis
MRIGIVSGEYPPDVGGVGDQAAHLAAALAAQGHDVQVVTTYRERLAPDPAAAASGAAGGAQMAATPGPEVLPVVRRWDWRLFALLPRLARAGPWDVLHLQYQPGAFRLDGTVNLLPAWLRRRQDAPAIVTTFHDLRVPYLFPKAGRLRPLAVRLLARACDGIVAAEPQDLHRLSAWTSDLAPPPAVRRIPLGNALDVAPPADFDRAAWRARLGLAADAALAGHFGFVNRTKGVDTLVDAVSRLVDGGRDVSLLMIGDPLGSSDPTNAAYLDAVRQRVAASGLERRVRWTGYCPPADVAGWLRCLDVAVLPFSEGASRRRTSIQAAWAQGVPVLTTTPAAPDAPGSEGLDGAVAVPPGDAPALAAALGDLLDRPERRAALALAGPRLATAFAWPTVAAATLDLYVAALSRRAATRAVGRAAAPATDAALPDRRRR